MGHSYLKYCLLLCFSFLLLYSCVSNSNNLNNLIANKNISEIENVLGVQENLNQADQNGNRPIHLAILNHLNSVLLWLIQRGADVNAPNALGQTPLILALKTNQPLMVQALAKAHANLFLTDKNKDIPITMAVSKDINQNTYAYEVILNKTNVEQKDSNGNTALHYISQFSSIHFAQRYIKLGGLLNIKNQQGLYPIDIALKHSDDLACAYYVYFLLQEGSVEAADPNYAYIYPYMHSGNFISTNALGENSLCQASGYGQISFMNFFIKQGVSVNSQDLAGNTPLAKVLENPMLDEKTKRKCINFLIKAGADVNACDFQKNSILDIALMHHCRLSIISLLLKNKADPDLKNSLGVNTLELSILLNSDFPIINQLIEHTHRIDNIDSTGKTSLIVATENQNSKVIKALLKHKADPFLKPTNPTHMSALSMAFAQGKAMTDLFYQNTRIYFDSQGNNFLQFLIEHKGNVDLVKSLINDGINVNHQNNYGQSSLYLSVESKQIPTVVILLNTPGTSFYQKDNRGKTVLSLIFDQGSDFVAKVIDNSTLLNQADRYHETPLFYAVKEHKNKIAQLLIRLGADLSVKNDSKKTIVHVAAQLDDSSVMATLISHKAPINDHDIFGNTPLHTAVSWSASSVVKQLIDAGAKIDVKNQAGFTPFYLAVGKNNLSITQLLLDNGADINSQNNLGQSPLFVSIHLDSTDMLKFLIDHHCQINLRDHSGSTALFYSLQNLNAQAISILLNNKANIFALNNANQSPISLALQSLDSCQMLINSGNINDQNPDGQTPTQLALLTKSPRTVLSYLLSLKPNLELTDKNGVSAASLAEKMGVDLA